MAGELRVLASIIRDRKAYDRITPHLGAGEFSEHAKVILGHVSDYYDRDPDAKSVDPELLARTLERGLPNPKHQELFKDMLAKVVALEVSPANVTEDFVAVRREATGMKLASALAAGASQEKVLPLLEEYDQWLDSSRLSAGRNVFTGVSVLDIAKARTAEGALIKVLPRALNEKLDGGLMRGHHVIVFGRPNMGKTTFAVNAGAGFLSQGLRVLHCGNEEPMFDVMLRYVGRLADMTKHEVLDNPVQADQLARAAGYDRLVLVGLTPGTPREIEALAREYKPDVIIIDQLRKLHVGKGATENFTRQLDEASAAMRTVGQRANALVVSFTQAGDSAEGKAVVGMGDVDSSNTGIPANADILIGMGGNASDLQMGRRVLNLIKNKTGGGEKPVPVMVDFTKYKMVGED